MSRAIIALGSNVADRKEFIQQALQRLSFSNKIVAISDVYETFGLYERRSPYLNCCVEIETDMKSQQLMLFLQEAQRQVTGATEESEGKDTLDCDLISFDQEVVRTPQLTLPHPRPIEGLLL